MSLETNYPQTSCPCSACPVLNKNVPNQKINPTNLGISNCVEYPSLKYCRDTTIYDKTEQPRLNLTKPEYKYLNDKHFMNFQGDFQPIKCRDDTVTWLSHDPRLLDPVRNSLLKLNAPPFTGEVPVGDALVDQIYTKKIGKVGKNYSNYSDIKGGQILYYYDNNQSEPYFLPNFTIKSEVDSVIFKDPMGSIKPQYLRKPIVENNLYNKPYACLQDVSDSLYHREDIMARQMELRNRQRYESRWNV